MCLRVSGGRKEVGQTLRHRAPGAWEESAPQIPDVRQRLRGGVSDVHTIADFLLSRGLK